MVKYIAKRRFNYVDATVMTLLAAYWQTLGWWSLAVFVGGVVVSAASEIVADRTAR